MTRFQRALLISFLIILADQIIKFWIKTNMTIGESIPFLGLSWFRIHFVENPGMAFGWKLGETDAAKIILTSFRAVAIIGIIWYLKQLIKRNAPKITTVSVAMILAGATGNLIDSFFYGILFSESTYHSVAEFLPEGETYGRFMHGAVVDMFYAPLFEGIYPDWVPWLGGSRFEFFRPVFNFADSSITVGVFLVIFFRKRFVMPDSKEAQTETATQIPDANTKNQVQNEA